MFEWLVAMLWASFVYGLLVALGLAKRMSAQKSFLAAFLPPLLPLLIITVKVMFTPSFPPGPLNELTLAVVWYMTLPAASCVGWLIGVSAPHVLRRLRDE